MKKKAFVLCLDQKWSPKMVKIHLHSTFIFKYIVFYFKLKKIEFFLFTIVAFALVYYWPLDMEGNVFIYWYKFCNCVIVCNCVIFCNCVVFCNCVIFCNCVLNCVFCYRRIKKPSARASKNATKNVEYDWKRLAYGNFYYEIENRILLVTVFRGFFNNNNNNKYTWCFIKVPSLSTYLPTYTYIHAYRSINQNCFLKLNS